jgi:hypothetical protein
VFWSLEQLWNVNTLQTVHLSDRPVVTIGTVPRAYEGMEGRKDTNIGTVPRAYEGMEGRKDTNIGTVTRAYEGMEGRKYTNIGTVPRAYEGMEGRKDTNKEMKKMQYKIKYKASKIHFLNPTISLPVKWEVCEKSTFLSLCVAKGAVGV